MTLAETSPGAADELATLREENAALHDLLDAIAAGLVPFPVEDGKTDAMKAIEAGRLDVITISAGNLDGMSASYLREVAARLRKRWEKPLPYTPSCGHDVYGQTGICRLPAGHPGDEHKTREQISAGQAAAPAPQAGEDHAGEEPCCSKCGARIGIFWGHGDGWHHWRKADGGRTEIYDAGHAPVPAGAR